MDLNFVIFVNDEHDRSKNQADQPKSTKSKGGWLKRRTSLFGIDLEKVQTHNFFEKRFKDLNYSLFDQPTVGV